MNEQSKTPERLECTETGFAVSAKAGSGKSAAVAGFAARINALGPRADAAPTDRVRVLEAIRAIAAQIDVPDCPGADSGYARCLLHEDPAGWSLAAIVLCPDQSTPAHDHGGWGGAATIRGVERDRRYVGDHRDGLRLAGEHDYPAGTGYLFDQRDVHQPLGIDPAGVTVALHFLVNPGDGAAQHVHEHGVPSDAAPPAM